MDTTDARDALRAFRADALFELADALLTATGEKRFPARRWVVERTLAWLSKCRALLVRYDKHAVNFLGLLKFACALLWSRRLHRLSRVRELLS